MSKRFERASKRRKKRKEEKNTKELKTQGFIEPGKGLTISLDGERMVTLPPNLAPWTAFVEAEMPEDVKGSMVDGLELKTKIFVNSRYQVCVTEDVPMHNGASVCTWLNIKRHDKESCHDWRDFQRIKNELCGEDMEGLELYPSETRMVDGSNQYHIWVFPKGTLIPVGFVQRAVVGDSGDGIESTEVPVGNGATAKQRTFEELPEDAMGTEEASEAAKAIKGEEGEVTG